MLRLMGAALTVLCAFLYSAHKNSAECSRIKKCKALTALLYECQTRLECHSLPISDIISGSPNLSCAGFADTVKRKGLAAAVEEYREIMLDGDEERALLSDFAAGFGHGYTDSEAKRCGEYIELLKRHTAALEDKAKTECKARLTVSLCVSLMAVLLFA